MIDLLENTKLIREFRLMHTFTVFPEDLNYMGTLFGGKALAEMDLAASNTARRLLYGTGCEGVVTASLDRVDFKKSAYLGDIIEMHTEVTRLGKTSIDVKVDVHREDNTGRIETICEAHFTFVAFREGKPYPHRCSFIDTVTAPEFYSEKVG
jgi:acyl-CoA hydrolase